MTFYFQDYWYNWCSHTKKKKETPAFLESSRAKASSTKKLLNE